MKFYKSYNLSASALIKRGAGLITGIFVASASGSPSVKVLDSLSTDGGSAVQATQVLTISGGVLVPGKHAENTLTSDATAPSNGKKVTVGTTVYTYKTALSVGPTVPYEVLIGISAAVALDNLKSAVNGSAGAGTTYSLGTVAHPDVVAYTNTDTTQLFVARVPGTAANTIVTTTDDSHLSWAETTLGGASATQIGVAPETFTIKTFQYAESVLTSDATVPSDGDKVVVGLHTYTFRTALSTNPSIPFEVLIGASASIALDNLKAAINGAAGIGTTYSAGTTQNPEILATTKTSTTLKVVANTAGPSQNYLPTTETSAHLSWEDTTLGGGTGASNPGSTLVDSQTYSFVTELSETAGAAAIPNEILWVTNDATALDNMKLAINAGATAGTNYSTGTVANVLVNATTNTNTAQTVAANTAVSGTAGNYITVTASIAHATWGTDTLTGGLDAGSIILNTFTPVAGTMYNLGQPIAFATGLYIVVAATCDITVFYD
jgi:hypothetical protein